jgi:hypothetical protein
VRKTFSAMPFDAKTQRFTKTGSGQTQAKMEDIKMFLYVGEAAFPVEYYSLVDLAVGTRPYINTDLGHLLVRTDCLATGETIGHDLCQTR